MKRASNSKTTTSKKAMEEGEIWELTRKKTRGMDGIQRVAGMEGNRRRNSEVGMRMMEIIEISMMIGAMIGAMSVAKMMGKIQGRDLQIRIMTIETTEDVVSEVVKKEDVEDTGMTMEQETRGKIKEET